MLSTRDILVQSILRECKDDYVGLWSIVREVRSILRPTTNLIDETISVIIPLIEQNRIVAGNFFGTDFVYSNEPPEIISRKISSEWAKLNRDPNIGEIIWFTIP